MKKPKGFFVYFHHSKIIGLLSDEQAGRLMKALMSYGDTGELSDFQDDGMLNMAYIMFKDEIDLNFEKYNEISEKRSQASQHRNGKIKNSVVGDNITEPISGSKSIDDDVQRYEKYARKKIDSRFGEL